MKSFPLFLLVKTGKDLTKEICSNKRTFEFFGNILSLHEIIDGTVLVLSNEIFIFVGELLIEIGFF